MAVAQLLGSCVPRSWRSLGRCLDDSAAKEGREAEPRSCTGADLEGRVAGVEPELVLRHSGGRMTGSFGRVGVYEQER